MIESRDLPPLSEGWVWTRLGEVCLDPQYGWTTSAIGEGTLRLLRTTDITSGHIDWSSVPFCKKEPPEKEKYLLNEGDIVISRAGSIGHSNLIKDPKEAIFASYLIRFKPLVEEHYLAFFLKSPFYWEAISEKSLGIAVPNVNATKLKQIFVPLPPLPEQHRIVAKIEELFTKLDAGIEELTKVKAQLKRYRQSVLKYAFEGKLTEEWRAKHKNELEPASVLLDRIKEERKKNANGKYKELPTVDTSELPELPEGWVWTRLGAVAEINPRFNGKDITDDVEITFLPMRCIEELTGHTDLSFTRRVSEVKKGYTPFKDDDLLFAKITPCMENGKVAIVYGLKNGIGFGSTEFHVIRLYESLPRKLFFFFLIREELRKDAQRNMTGSAGQLRVPVNYIRQILIPFPPLPEQHKIVEKIERRFSVADAVEKVVDQNLKQAERLRQSILKQAFEGKLVPQDPTDEPASVLLERIIAERENRKIEMKPKPTKIRRKRDLVQVQKQTRFNDYV